jgi:hypothetical protein
MTKTVGFLSFRAETIEHQCKICIMKARQKMPYLHILMYYKRVTIGDIVRRKIYDTDGKI